jgi:hypothetical protein
LLHAKSSDTGGPAGIAVTGSTDLQLFGSSIANVTFGAGRQAQTSCADLRRQFAQQRQRRRFLPAIAPPANIAPLGQYVASSFGVAGDANAKGSAAAQTH